MRDGDVHDWQSGLGCRLRAGDRGALLEFYDQMGSFVYGLALRIAASGEVAAQITEDVFLHIWDCPQELEGHGDSIRTRLAVLTHGRALEWIRRSAEGAGDDGHRGELCSFSDGEELAESLATAGRVQGAVAELSPEEHLALEVTYFGGNTCEAAAVILGVTGAVVAARVSAALHHVAGSLKPCAAGQPGIAGLDGTEIPRKGQIGEGVDPDAAR